MTVILVTLDGVRPDAIQQATTPTLDRLLADGASCMTAQSVMPSITLPCHMSIFHSLPPERHGILDNEYHSMVRPVPGLFEQVKNAGKRTASLKAWQPLRDLGRPLSLDYALQVGVQYSKVGTSDEPVIATALPLIQSDAYDFMFLYIGSTDEVGHRDGWMSEGYLKQIEVADSYLSQVMDVLPDGSHILVEADHGGHDRNHGTDMAEDMTIPWIVWGEQIKRGHTVVSEVSLLDTAPTLAKILNVPAAPQWEGQVIEEIFV